MLSLKKLQYPCKIKVFVYHEEGFSDGGVDITFNVEKSFVRDGPRSVIVDGCKVELESYMRIGSISCNKKLLYRYANL